MFPFDDVIMTRWLCIFQGSAFWHITSPLQVISALAHVVSCILRLACCHHFTGAVHWHSISPSCKGDQYKAEIWLAHICSRNVAIGLLLPPVRYHPTDTYSNNDAKITSSLRQHDVGDVVLTLWRRYYCVACSLGIDHVSRDIQGVRSGGYCVFNTVPGRFKEYHFILGWATTFLACLIPFVYIITFNVFIVCALIRRRKQFRSNHDNEAQNNGAVAILISVSITFIILTLPISICFLLQKYYLAIQDYVSYEKTFILLNYANICQSLYKHRTVLSLWPEISTMSAWDGLLRLLAESV